MPFFGITIDEFDKMQIPLNSYGYTVLLVLFRDNRSLRFCASTSVGALFYV